MKPTSTADQAVWRNTWRLIAANKLTFAALTLFSVAGAVLALVPEILVQRYLDTLVGLRIDQPLSFIMALLIGITLGRVTLSYLQIYPDILFFGRCQIRVRSNVLRGVLSRPPALVQAISTGDALTRLHHDASEFSDWPRWLPFVLAKIIFGLGAVLVMFRIDPALTAWACLPLLLVAVGVRIARARFLSYAQANRDANSAVSGFLGEILTTVQTIQINRAESAISDRYQQLCDKRARTEISFRLAQEIIRSVAGNTSQIVMGLLLLVIAARGHQTLSVGEITLFIGYLSSGALVDLPEALGGFIADYQTQALSLHRLGEIIDSDDADKLTRSPEHRKQPSRPASLQSLQVQGLGYHHPDSHFGLCDISFEINPGETVAIVGRMGSGKSTLLQTVLGMLPRQEGQILWNGETLGSTERLEPPRAAYLAQQPRLLSETIVENIALGWSDSIDMDGVIQQARFDVDLDSLPDGMNTLVGPNGVRLSGGQVRRVALARALLRKPDLLVIDNLTSALDQVTAHEIWENLTQEQGRQAILIASHERAVLDRADRILVMQNGSIIDQGSVVELLSRCKLFRGLYEEQNAASTMER